MDQGQPVLISVVSPVYRAEGIVDLLVERIKKNLVPITENFEIILVEDCGPDQSWQQIEKNCKLDKRVKGIRLSRNFGQHYAITAGLDVCKGEWVVVMDCDLQDRPEEIPQLYKKTQEGYDIVLARRTDRQDGFFKRLFSRMFYRMLGYLTETKQDHTVANFGIYHKKAIAAVVAMRENIRYFPTAIKWVGFNLTSIEVEHAEREIGATSYNFSKLFKLALNTIIAFSDKPLKLVIRLGLTLSGLSVAVAVYIIIRALTGNYSVMGWPSLIVSIWFLSGLIIFTLGILGVYISKIFNEVKNRPLYIIKDQVNLNNEL